ncbi:MAG: neutral/alkaline non-lysosomal ceramidase N-terminal domain-containing protein [Verrucomicrobiales bacterium]|nr:neutral/alkaline non-lysosomal ceramidase N-terminal domain-containing protein [Verrucomicrobiales bacterium]
MKASSPSRLILRRALRMAFWTFAALFLALLGRCLYAFRDRTPGYTVSLNINGQAARSALKSLRAGFGRIRISPDLADPKRPIWLAGFNQNRTATGIHDDLWAVACVVDDGATRLGIVALDAIGFFHDDVVEVRRRLAPEWKLDYVVVCSTHNHSAPDLLGLWGPNYLTTGVDASYRQQVIAGAERALGEAVANLQPARMALHEIRMKPEGYVADTRKPIVFDPDLRVMHFTRAATGVTLGSIVGWANHPETPWARNTEITADFPGYLRDALEHGIRQGEQVRIPGLGGTHVYANGAVGGLMTPHPSVTVTNSLDQVLYAKPSHDKTRALGQNLALQILDRLGSSNASATSQIALQIHARTITLPLDNKGFLLAPVLGVINRGHTGWRKLRTEVALIRMGDASIACIPGEIYPEIINGGIERAPGGDFDLEPVEVPPLRELMPGQIKFIFGLANDEIGYIIPKSEWDTKPPYLYGATKALYGEINSVGPETAARIHAALRDLCDLAAKE